MTEAPRPLRADARRKREAVVGAAREVFAERGVDIALEEVARRAGVGIATLYRHFPTREALIAGVYLREVDLLCDGVADLLADQPPDRALVTWMRRFIGYVGGKRGMAVAMKSIVMTSDSALFRPSHDRVHAAMDRLIDAGETAGVFRTGAQAQDLVLAMTGFCLVTDRPGWQDRADRLVQLLVDGLRAVPGREAP
ncbi:TetR/AcrR family transcriptional regulator [Streptomyces sp. SL13]|uniref:TetR/AcrR family transcriptional regulator n=1 Tax=Streptantibioticus silvisoli TaxID=2705255 RepID=A0AA90KAS7_9ACTN|nr:TetR/AcrR family transcriptional regulator [Streptantibioticus silvisoli]MDI5972462.1 TetR/AcrR family transcriptional regulator [Streptantibioticus silvisoli]